MDPLSLRLDQLEAAQLIRRLQEEELAYLFKHTLTQESAYESLLVKSRRQIHARVAEAYERLHPDRLDENAALLEQHYAEAGNAPKTLEYAVRAGDFAFRHYAHAEAIAHYRRALDTIRGGVPADDELIIHLFSRLGRTFELSGRYDLSLQNAQEMKAFGHARGDRKVELAAILLRALIHAIHSPMHEPEYALELGRQALQLAGELNDAPARARALWIMSLAYLWVGSAAEAQQAGEESLRLAREFQLREQMAYTLSDLAYAYGYGGKIEPAIASRREADLLWRELDNKAMLSDNLSGLAAMMLASGQHAEARRTLDESIAVSRRIDNLWGEAYGLAALGLSYAVQGDVDRALQALSQARDLGLEGRAYGPLFSARMGLAEMYLELGRSELAMEQAELGKQEASKHLPEWGAWTMAMTVHIHLRRNEVHEAAQIFRQAAFEPPSTYFNKTPPRGSFLIALTQIEMALAQRDQEHALGLIDNLEDLLHNGGARVFLPEALLLHGTVELQAGRLDEARARLLEGIALGEAMELHAVLYRLYGLLAEVETTRGDEQAAADAGQAAAEQVGWIASHTPAELRASFLARAEVRAIDEGRTAR